MINQQLLDYIKQQVLQGVNREQIKSSLMTNGWQASDIEEGFSAASSPVPPSQYLNSSINAPTKIWKILAASLVGLVVIGGGIYFVTQTFFKSEGKSILSNEATQPPIEKTELPTSANETPANITTTETARPQIINCGTSVNFQKSDCFFNAAKSCSLAKITDTIQYDLFGLITETITFYEIKGWQENKCVFYIKSMGGKATFSQEAIQQALNSGATNEEIKQQEQETSNMAKLTIGRDGTCKFANTNDLISLLNKWKGGSFSTSDFKNIDCKGAYFEPFRVQ